MFRFFPLALRIMKKIHYILSPVFYFLIALAGRSLTAQGVNTWYPALVKPEYTPPGSLIGMTWTLIYILAAASLIIFVNRARNSPVFWSVILLYIINGVLNGLWSYLFFTKHLLGPAVFDAAILATTVALIMIMTRRYAYLASVLLLPYFLWVCFATYLAYDIFMLN